MFAHRIETVIQEEGKLHLESLPFTKGDSIEIIILKKDTSINQQKKKRTMDEYVGKIRMSDDFSAPLPDEFWLGKESS